MGGTIGWTTTLIRARMKQGAAGTLRIVLTVLKPDDTPLDSYDGFTAALSFYNPRGFDRLFGVVPAVTGDAEAHTITIDIPFRGSETRNVHPAQIIGDLRVRDPSGDAPVDRYPASILIDLDRTFAEPAA